MLNSQSQKTLYGLMDMIYPVGSYYITESSDLDTVAKMNAKFGGTWVQLDAGRFLESVTSGAGGNKDAGLPNITGTFIKAAWFSQGGQDGAFVNAGLKESKTTAFNNSSGNGAGIKFDASRSSSIYGKSNTVQPKSRTVYIYRRKALAGAQN